MNTRMPRFYRPPHGLPLFWRDEVSGQLPAAVQAYLDNRCDGAPISDEQIALLRDYIHHYIHAPCWEQDAFAAELKELRGSVDGLTSSQAIADWIWKALEIGLDPL
jgi:hypothetical protein